MWLWLLLVASLVVAGCSKDDDGGGDGGVKSVALDVAFDWSEWPDAHPTSMRLWVIPEDGGDAIPCQLSGRDGGRITVPASVLTIVAVNGDATGLTYSYDRSGALLIGTSETSTLSPMGRGDSDVPRAEGTENDPVMQAPPEVYAGSATHVDAGKGRERQVTIVMSRRVTECEVEVRNVENLDNAMSVSGTLSGMAGQHAVVANAPAGVSTLIPFTLKKIDESTLRGSFYCFGHCPAGAVKHKVVVYAVMKLGSQRYQIYGDATDVVTPQVHQSGGKKMRIVLYGLNLPQSTEGTPMEPSIDDWLTEDIVVDL